MLYIYIKDIPKDLSNICTSYLNHNDIIYYLGDWTKFDKHDICTISGQNGWIDVLEWGHNNKHYATDLHCFWLIIGTAEYGHLEMLKYLHNCGYEMSWEATVGAARYGHLDILKWLKEMNCYEACGDKAIVEAARNGHLEIIKWARSNNDPWNENVCNLAKLNKHFELLNWLKNNDCPCKGSVH